MNFDEAHAVYDAKIKGVLKQSLVEAAEAFDEIARFRARRYLEIGCAWGGTLYIYAHACRNPSLLVGLDTGTAYRSWEKLEATCGLLGREGFTVVLMKADSHLPETVERVRKIAGTFDVIHVDGDHKLPGVTADWQNYSDLVELGGIMLFHDVARHVGATRVYLLWEELVKTHRTLTIDSGDKMGIGIVYF